jgi:glycosyltransferase involved in cell wall biosynthesis
MASGLPIVTTATCGMRDVIRDKENGLLVPLGSPGAIIEAVEALLRDATFRGRLGHAAQGEALERYTWAHAAAPMLKAYERLYQNRAQRVERTPVASAT